MESLTRYEALIVSTATSDSFVHRALLERYSANSRSNVAREKPSNWSTSFIKRCFDLLAVVAVLPIMVPVLVAVSFAVCVSSRGPILFIQTRIGRDGKCFKIYKFRTMVRSSDKPRPLVTTIRNQHFTSIGPFLRWWKLDELPQIFNVLRGDMSLVGPRPKVPEHQVQPLACRPGITGAATLAFAREELILTHVRPIHLHTFVHEIVLPLKHSIDAEYMANATFSSDLKLVLRSVFRRWHFLRI